LILVGWQACAVLMLMPLAVTFLARPVGAGSVAELEGVWAVARATLNGEPRTEAKVLNADARRPVGQTGVCRRRPQGSLANRTMKIDEELSLGSGAFSAASGWTVILVADRRGTAMILTLEALRVERADLQRFAARVLDAL
jgi:hypothetical protein